MTLTTRTALQEAYANAVERNVAKSLETQDDWDRYKTLLATREQRLAEEQKDFSRNYLSRLAEAKQIIMREEHGKDFDEPLPEGVSRQSSASMLDRKADGRVRQDHERRIAVIHEDHRNALSELYGEIEQRRAQTRATPDLERDWNAAIVRSGPKRT